MKLRLQELLQKGRASLARLGSSEQLDVVDGLCDTPRLVRAIAATMPEGSVLRLYSPTEAIAAAARAFALPTSSWLGPDLVVPLSPTAAEALSQAARPDYALATAFFVCTGPEKGAAVLIENYDGADYVCLSPALAPDVVRRLVALSGGRLLRAREEGRP